MEICLRDGAPGDLEAVVAIQDASPELAAWTAESLARVLAGEGCAMRVAEWKGIAAAFLLWREIPGGEVEILSLGVAPEGRRKGLGRAILSDLLEGFDGDCFLEVRESNTAARALYGEFGFIACGVRRAYYHRPVENAVVMRRTKNVSKEAGLPR